MYYFPSIKMCYKLKHLRKMVYYVGIVNFQEGSQNLPKSLQNIVVIIADMMMKYDCFRWSEVYGAVQLVRRAA